MFVEEEEGLWEKNVINLVVQIGEAVHKNFHDSSS